MEGKRAIQKIIKLAYMSAFLKNEKPLSLMLIAPPEQSKTHYLMSFKTRYAHISTDLSYFGLIDILMKNQKIKHIVIPDFLKVTEKNQNTKRNIISSLNAYLEEGIFSVNLANMQKIDLKGRTGGLITATTKSSFFQNKRTWNGMGFKSRFIICSWEYSDKTIDELLTKISKQETTKNGKQETLNYTQKYIKIKPDVYQQLHNLADRSPRKLKNLKVFCKALALYNNKTEVGEEEINEIKELNKYMNLRFNKI